MLGARDALDAGQNAKAEAMARAILGSQPQALVEASALETLVNALVNLDRGESDEALSGAQRCLELRTRLLRGDDPDLARAHSVLARVQRARRQYDEALASYQRALDGLAPVAEVQAEVVANIRMNRANLLVSRGNADVAVVELGEVLETYQRLFGEQHRLTAFAHYNLARGQERLGELEAALSHHEAAVAIRTALLPAEAALCATSAHEYGELLQAVGALSEARERFALALRLREQELGGTARPTLDSLDKLGDVELALGRPELAREHFERAQVARQAALEPNHVDLARSERNLGNVALELGDWETARARFERALAIREAQAKRSTQREAEELNNLAVAMGEAGDAAAATATYRRLLTLHAQVLPEDHVDLAKDRLNLALSRLREGDPSEAEQLAQAATTQLASADDPVALRSALLVRGNVHLERDRLELAQQDFQASVELSTKLYGAEHVETAYAMEWLARSLARRGETDAALDAALAAERISRRDLRERTQALPEREALRYREAGHVGLGLALALAETAPSRWLEIYDAVVQSRALVLDELSQRDAAKLDPERAALRQRARERYSFASARGADAAELERLRAAKEQTERAPAPRAAELERTPGAREVLAELSPGELLLSYVLADTDEGALLIGIAADRSGVQRVRKLAAAGEIAHAIAIWRAAILSQSDRVELAARALDAVLIEPFAIELRAAERIFVVAAGPLHLVPFVALVDSEGRYRLEMPAIWHLLDTERDRVAFAKQTKLRQDRPSLLAVGGADFGPLRGEMPACPKLSELRFEMLPGSAREARAIAELWRGQKQTLLGAQASEPQVLAAMQRAEVVHLATHGFFLPRDCSPQAPNADRVRGLGKLVRPPSAQATPAQAAESPLLRSGLALAGANQRSQSRDGRSDGILTAEELGGLELSHVEWMVLSACDTGLGELAAGEGVLGLRRALRRAGAATVLMSLWPIDDESASTWMLELYRARFAERLDTARAVRAAQWSALRRGAHPFEWAGFVAVGDWR